MILARHPDIPRDLGLKFIGYWQAHDNKNLPRPADYVDHRWSPRERMIVTAYLKNGQPWERWFGPSHCRFGCERDDVDMGCSDLSDGVYVWPEGFAHYVEKHDVKPPQEFIDHVMRRKPVTT